MPKDTLVEFPVRLLMNEGLYLLESPFFCGITISYAEI